MLIVVILTTTSTYNLVNTTTATILVLISIIFILLGKPLNYVGSGLAATASTIIVAISLIHVTNMVWLPLASTGTILAIAGQRPEEKITGTIMIMACIGAELGSLLAGTLSLVAAITLSRFAQSPRPLISTLTALVAVAITGLTGDAISSSILSATVVGCIISTHNDWPSLVTIAALRGVFTILAIPALIVYAFHRAGPKGVFHVVSLVVVALTTLSPLLAGVTLNTEQQVTVDASSYPIATGYTKILEFSVPILGECRVNTGCILSGSTIAGNSGSVISVTIEVYEWNTSLAYAAITGGVLEGKGYLSVAVCPSCILAFSLAFVAGVLFSSLLEEVRVQ